MISAVIITYDEQDRIKKCLESIKWVDEIIIVDAGSTDETLKICKEYTDKIYVVNWQGYAKQKNFGIEKAKGDWILSIDSDEIVPKELEEEIKNAILEDKYHGYFIPRKSFFLEKWINHCGWYPDYQLRLFKKGYGKFKERPVHEGVEVHGEKGNLKNVLIHYPYKDINKYFEKFNEYTSLAAGELNKKRKFSLLRLIFEPRFVFFRSYILKKGFLDGRAGFTISVFNAMNTFVKHAKHWEMKK